MMKILNSKVNNRPFWVRPTNCTPMVMNTKKTSKKLSPDLLYHQGPVCILGCDIPWLFYLIPNNNNNLESRNIVVGVTVPPTPPFLNPPPP